MTTLHVDELAVSTNGNSLNSIGAFGEARATVAGAPLSADELARMHAIWRASNYLALGMTY